MSECLTPIHLSDSETGHETIVPCGKCNACLVRSRMEWAFRLRQEQQDSDASYFVTLTYDNEDLKISTSVESSTGALVYDGAVDKRDVQLFMKRLRKGLSKENIKLRYYLVSEYGPATLRPHYHFIAFLHPYISKDEFDFYVRLSWPSPNIEVSVLAEERILYVTEYCIIRDSIPSRLEPNFRLMSRNPGIGAGYIDRMKGWHLGVSDLNKRFNLLDRNGYHCNMPRYYRERIYPDEFLSEHAAECSKRGLDKEIQDLVECRGNRMALAKRRQDRIDDYRRRTEYFLNKKAHKPL